MGSRMGMTKAAVAVAERHCGMEWRGLCSSSGFSGPSTVPQRANVTADQRCKFKVPFHMKLVMRVPGNYRLQSYPRSCFVWRWCNPGYWWSDDFETVVV